MMWKRERISRDPAELWRFLLEEGKEPDTLILVNNLLMVREVRRKWQRDLAGFATDIRTLTSFLEELALHGLDDEDLPELVPSSQERTLWLEQWLSSHGNPEYRRFSDVKSVTAISNIIGNFYREGHNPGVLYDTLVKESGRPAVKTGSERYVLAELLRDYENRMAEKKWLDREQLPGKMTKCDSKKIYHKKLVLFFPDEVDPVHEHALRLLSETDLVVIKFDADESDPIILHTKQIPSGDTDVHHFYLNTFHHPREELEQSVRQILAIMTQQGEKSDSSDSGSYSMPINDNERVSLNRNNALRYDDFVILTGDLSLYEPMVPSISGRYGIPLYTSRGASLISHPFIRRLLTYLKLGITHFQIDDIFRVFADNRIVLPDLQDHDAEKAPNIRHFCQFCRKYNFRTLDDAANGMDRVFDALLDHVHFEDDEQKEQQRRMQERANRDFYFSVIAHLDALRHFYRTSERLTMSEWVDWTRSLVGLQKDMMSREANEARELLDIILDTLSRAQSRLGLSQKIGCRDFFKLLELRLKETRERPEEKPGGVLLTEIRHLPEVHDKIVFVLGLHEDGFPGSDKPDFLQFRYEQVLGAITGKKGTETYDLARMQFQRLLASNMPRFVSRPNQVKQKPVMPSPLWLELKDELVSEQKKWPVTIEKWVMSDFELGRNAARIAKEYDSVRSALFISANSDALSSPIPPNIQKNYLFSWQLASCVEKARHNTEVMGSYDGVLDPLVAAKWLETHFGEKRMNMSISRLDTFASSPQEFFFRYVLRLEPLHEYQDDAESNIKGSLLHHILQNFYSGTDIEGPPVLPAENYDAACKRMDRIRHRLVESCRHQLGNPESPFPVILERNMERVTRWFLEFEKAGNEQWLVDLDDARPAVFYHDCGFEMEHQWSFEKKLNNETVLFRGMIDRIDLARSGEYAIIYDYKSGKTGVRKYAAILNGMSFQLPVYAMYLRLHGIRNFIAGYYTLPVNGKRKDVSREFSLGSAELIEESHMYTKEGKRKRFKEQFKSSDEMDAFMQAIEERRIAWIVNAIRDGRFHVSLTGDPSWSDFRHISRYDIRIQQQRKNREVARRRKKGLICELDRYYLSEPFWEDDNDVR